VQDRSRADKTNAGMICAAMRAASDGTPASPEDRSVNMAAPKQMNMLVRSRLRGV